MRPSRGLLVATDPGDTCSLEVARALVHRAVFVAGFDASAAGIENPPPPGLPSRAELIASTVDADALDAWIRYGERVASVGCRRLAEGAAELGYSFGAGSARYARAQSWAASRATFGPPEVCPDRGMLADVLRELGRLGELDRWARFSSSVRALLDSMIGPGRALDRLGAPRPRRAVLR